VFASAAHLAKEKMQKQNGQQNEKKLSPHTPTAQSAYSKWKQEQIWKGVEAENGHHILCQRNYTIPCFITICRRKEVRFKKPEEKETIDLILNLMTEVIKNKTDRRINQSRIPFERLKEQLLTLKKEHIDYVLLVLSENKNKISNLRAYLLSLLYNAPVNILGMKVHQEPASVDYSKDQQIWQAFLDTT